MSGNAGEGPRGGVNIAGRVGSVGGDIVGRDQGSVIDPVTALAWSQQVVQTIAMRAVQQGTGAPWIGLNPTGDGKGWTLSKLGQDLYGGKPGIALFLAAHTGVSGVASSRELALQALAGTRYIIRSNGVGRFARVTGVGAASGLGGLVYVLTSIAGLINEPALIDDARKVALLMNDDLIANDKMYDVISGAAGGILGLLKLYRQTGDDFVLTRAIACGRHLLRTRSTHRSKYKLWLHLEGEPLTGFSHGAAGFAYALAALAKASGIEAFAATASECVAYERALFSPERSNWPDFRQFERQGEPAWPCQWCHGAGGIGLARIGMMRFGIVDDEVLSEIRHAVEAVLRYGRSPIDTLCCGNLGNAELLAEASRVLGDEALSRIALRQLGSIMETATRTGRFGWHAGNNDDNLGLFSGLSGVGYTLLRSIAHEKVPNVLLWE